MQAGKKHDVHTPEPVRQPEAPAVSDVAAENGPQRRPVAGSPARALQHRLQRELANAPRQWVWHSAGLILAALLSLFMAGIMLNSGL